ncbi:MAG: hypothetical protein ACR2N3_16215 [Pyrinomonadaceae bacterium]
MPVRKKRSESLIIDFPDGDLQSLIVAEIARSFEMMSLEKESKMLEQAIAVMLLVTTARLLIWGLAFVSAAYILKFLIVSPLLYWAAASVATVAVVIITVVRKLYRK